MNRSMTGHIYTLCELCLKRTARRLKIPYESLCVWLFCVIWPLITIALALIVLLQWLKMHSPGR